jgi:hypothetical protein
MLTLHPGDQARVLAYLQRRVEPATRGQIMAYASVSHSPVACLQVWLADQVDSGLVEQVIVDVFWNAWIDPVPTAAYLASAGLRAQDPIQIPRRGPMTPPCSSV